MTSSTGTSGTRRSGSDAVSDALDELYAASPNAFVARRRELVAELRAAGDRAASRLVSAVTKPTRTAWALNQLARTRPELLRAVFEARDAAIAAQKRGEFEPVQAATRIYRERVAEVVRAARSALLEAGVTLTTPQARAEARRIGETLQAAHADSSPARERLLAGRLARDIEVDDPLGGLQMSVPAPTGEPPHAPPETRARQRPIAAPAPTAERERQRALQRQREKEEQARKRHRAIEAARREVSSLEEAARVARAEAEESRFAAQRAQAAAERAKRAAMEADDGLNRARAHLRALEG